MRVLEDHRDLVLLLVTHQKAVFPDVLREPVQLPAEDGAVLGHRPADGEHVAGLELAALLGAGADRRGRPLFGRGGGAAGRAHHGFG